MIIISPTGAPYFCDTDQQTCWPLLSLPTLLFLKKEKRGKKMVEDHINHVAQIVGLIQWLHLVGWL